MSNREWSPVAVSRFRNSGTIGTPFHRRTAEAGRTPWYCAWDLYHVVDSVETE